MALTRTHDGEQVAMPETRRRWTDRELRRKRAADMLLDRLAGLRTREIARIYKLTPQHVNREIRAIPEYLRTRIARAHRRGEIGLERLQSAG